MLCAQTFWPGKIAAFTLSLASLLCLVLPPPAAHAHHLTKSASTRAQTGRASYYSSRLTGRRTASGQRLRARGLTAASRTLPLGARARVTNTKNGRSVSVTVTDRGPFKGRRILDVSPAAAERLGMMRDGVALVKVEPLGPPPT